MRLFALAILLCAGCDDETTAMPIHDLSVPADQAVAELTCAQIVDCIYQCSAATVGSCVPACINRGSAAALTAFSPLQTCSAPACYSADGGAPPCATPGSATCMSCVQTQCGSQLSNCLSH